MAVSSYFGFRQELSQQATLIIVPCPVVVLRLFGYPRGLLELSSCVDPQTTIVHCNFNRTFFIDRVDRQWTFLVEA